MGLGGQATQPLGQWALLKAPEGWDSETLALKVGELEVGDSGPLSILGKGTNGVWRP